MKSTKIRMVILLLIGLMESTGAWAIPAKRVPFTVTNSDGTVLTLVLCGDESYHFYATTDGIPAVQEECGDWVLKPEWRDSIEQTWKERCQIRNAYRIERAERRRANHVAGQPTSLTGDKKGIVILVNFRNLSMKSSHTREAFDEMFNKVGYTDNRHYGSVHDYFYDQSYGKLNLTFDVYGPITTTGTYANYGKNNEKGNDGKVAMLAAEVCNTANSLYRINWSDYDWDGDGEVDQVYIIYAGIGEAGSGEADQIWPHEWSLNAGRANGDGGGSITLGGVTINTYAMSDELANTRSGQKLNGIGSACHEFSHCLGLPDFYDTSYKGGFGMDAWDIMASGSYNGATGHGECPPGYTAYERWYAGWLEMTELNEATTITDMPDLQDEPVAYIIRNRGAIDEFFTLENRQAKGWYQYVGSSTGCHGMLVCHIDHDAQAWRENTVNSEATHQRMTIIPASGVYGNRASLTADQYRSQLFPGLKAVTVLDNDSHKYCGGTLFNKNFDDSYNMNKPITEIAEQDGLISFKFMGGGDALGVEEITEKCLDETNYYTLGGMQVPRPTTSGVYLMKKGAQTQKVFIP